MTKKELKYSITSASTRNVEAVTKICEKIATFAPAPIPSLAEGAARRPVTTCRYAKMRTKREEKTTKNNQPSHFTVSAEAVTKIAEKAIFAPKWPRF